MMIARALNISTDPGCRGAMNPDIALSCRSGSGITVSLSSCAGHSDMVVSWSSDTNTDSGGWFDPRLLQATYENPDPDCYRTVLSSFQVKTLVINTSPRLLLPLRQDLAMEPSLTWNLKFSLSQSSEHWDYRCAPPRRLSRFSFSLMEMLMFL